MGVTNKRLNAGWEISYMEVTVLSLDCAFRTSKHLFTSKLKFYAIHIDVSVRDQNIVSVSLIQEPNQVVKSFRPVL